MTRRPTAAVYRRRRLAVGLGAVAVVGILVWLASLAASALGGGNDKAAGIASASADASASGTVSVTPVPVGGTCDPADIVVRPVPQAAYASGPVTLKFQVFTMRNPQCVWKATHGSVQILISQHGNPFWSTVDCPAAVVAQTVTLEQGTPKVLALATWNGHGSSNGAGCGVQGPWSTPHSYIVQAAPLGGNPARGELQLVAPGQPLVQPTQSTTPSASSSAPSTSSTAKPSASASGTASPRPKAKPSPSPTPTTSVWN